MNERLSKYFVSSVAVFAVFMSTYVCAHTEEFYWNHELISLETPTPVTVHEEGHLLALESTDSSGQYILWTSLKPAAGWTIDQAIAMVTTIAQEDGVYVSKISKSFIDNRWVADIEGVVPSDVMFMKGRIIVTEKNAFFLETLYWDNTESHLDFISKFKIDNE
jgi:hypothetical protein